MLTTILALALTVTPPKTKAPDIIIGIVSVSKPDGLREEGEVLMVYEPGALAVRLNSAVSLRPHVTLRHGTLTGDSVSAGVQFVWARKRSSK